MPEKKIKLTLLDDYIQKKKNKANTLSERNLETEFKDRCQELLN